MDGIEGIVVAFVELIVVAVQLVAYFILFLFELLIWGILAIRGKKGERPKMNLLSKERVKERVLQKALIFLGFILIVGGGILHQHFFSARISFSSDSIFRLSSSVKYELRSESGRKSAQKGSEEYLTYRWDHIVITDERFEPETYALTKEDQTIALKSVGVEKVKEDLVNKLKDTLVNGLFDKAKEKLSSTLEKEKK